MSMTHSQEENMEMKEGVRGVECGKGGREADKTNTELNIS